MMSNKNKTSDLGASILREQRLLRRERLLSNPGLIIGACVFLLIVLAAIIIPAVSKTDPKRSDR